MADPKLSDGERIMLVDDRGRRCLKRLKAGHRITVRGSVIAADDLIGHPEGNLTSGSEPEQFMVFRPTYAELITLRAREAEPVFPKDIGTVLTRGDVRPGDTVIEVGAGSGALTVALLRMVGAAGSVVTYEIREDFAENAKKTVTEMCGDHAPWECRIGDARDGFTETGVDHVVADMPDPAGLINAAAEALRPGGTFVFYVPTVPQFAEARTALDGDRRFALAETVEVLERGWYVRHPSVRPDHRMVAHTGFVSVARRTAAAIAAVNDG